MPRTPPVNRKCSICHRPISRATECDGCKAERRRLRDIRRGNSSERDPVERESRALRVDLYAAVVVLGGRLFE